MHTYLIALCVFSSLIHAELEGPVLESSGLVGPECPAVDTGMASEYYLLTSGEGRVIRGDFAMTIADAPDGIGTVEFGHWGPGKDLDMRGRYTRTDTGGDSLVMIAGLTQDWHWMTDTGHAICSTYSVNRLDHTEYLPGDSNTDEAFDSSDLVVAFQAGQYQGGEMFQVRVPDAWRAGDWTGDQQFDSSDLVHAFTFGHYGATKQAISVPEPNTVAIFAGLLMWVTGAWLRKKHQTGRDGQASSSVRLPC